MFRPQANSRMTRIGTPVFFTAVLLSAFLCSSASAAPMHPLAIGWDWWLAPNFAEHGKSIDRIFLFIFWITTIILVGTEAVLVYFAIKYRFRPNRRGVFTHGNTRLEMIWTLIPAVILIVLALWTKRVWEDYRYSAAARDPRLVRVLVIGQQFKWNVVYPGPDGKLGRYLIYPKTTDLKWPAVPEGKSFTFPPVEGPAYLPEAQARRALNNYIETVNPLGKDFDDPDGADDDWRDALARPLWIPKGRPVEVQIGSRDVIHDFYLPNFRVKLDAVPGMRGVLYFTPIKSSRELQEKPRAYSLDDLKRLVLLPGREVVAVVNENSKGAQHEVKKRPRPVDYWRYATKDGQTILRDGSTITPADVDALGAAGISEVTAYSPYYWDLVCEELCGQGHYTMQDKVIVLEEDELRKPPYAGFYKPLPSPVAMQATR